MQATDSGWVASLPLKPGNYSYKYIIDGKWTTDQFNKQKESDSYHEYNSVLFCYNCQFKLYGYKDALQVNVAGSFNDWNNKELKMMHLTTGWTLYLYLKEGTH